VFNFKKKHFYPMKSYLDRISREWILYISWHPKHGAFCEGGHWHSENLRRHRHNGICNLSPVPDQKTTGLRRFIPVTSSFCQAFIVYTSLFPRK
jgi:hypothetical protein